MKRKVNVLDLDAIEEKLYSTFLRHFLLSFSFTWSCVTFVSDVRFLLELRFSDSLGDDNYWWRTVDLLLTLLEPTSLMDKPLKIETEENTERKLKTFDSPKKKKFNENSSFLSVCIKVHISILRLKFTVERSEKKNFSCRIIRHWWYFIYLWVDFICFGISFSDMKVSDEDDVSLRQYFVTLSC